MNERGVLMKESQRLCKLDYVYVKSYAPEGKSHSERAWRPDEGEPASLQAGLCLRKIIRT